MSDRQGRAAAPEGAAAGARSRPAGGIRRRDAGAERSTWATDLATLAGTIAVAAGVSGLVWIERVALPAMGGAVAAVWTWGLALPAGAVRLGSRHRRFMAAEFGLAPWPENAAGDPLARLTSVVLFAAASAFVAALAVVFGAAFLLLPVAGFLLFRDVAPALVWYGVAFCGYAFLAARGE